MVLQDTVPNRGCADYTDLPAHKTFTQKGKGVTAAEALAGGHAVTT